MAKSKHSNVHSLPSKNSLSEQELEIFYHIMSLVDPAGQLAEREFVEDVELTAEEREECYSLVFPSASEEDFPEAYRFSVIIQDPVHDMPSMKLVANAHRMLFVLASNLIEEKPNSVRNTRSRKKISTSLLRAIWMDDENLEGIQTILASSWSIASRVSDDYDFTVGHIHFMRSGPDYKSPVRDFGEVRYVQANTHVEAETDVFSAEVAVCAAAPELARALTSYADGNAYDCPEAIVAVKRIISVWGELRGIVLSQEWKERLATLDDRVNLEEKHGDNAEYVLLEAMPLFADLILTNRKAVLEAVLASRNKTDLCAKLGTLLYPGLNAPTFIRKEWTEGKPDERSHSIGIIHDRTDWMKHQALLSKAIQVLGSEADAKKFLLNPHGRFQYQTPIEVAESQGGVEKVLSLLRKIKTSN
jgi:Protein of unknown function (DUF2384)